MLEAVVDAVGLARVKLVPDPVRSAVLRQDPLINTLRLSRSGPEGLDVELHMPWGTADAVTLRRVQEIVVDLHDGLDFKPADPLLGMRFAHWQRSLAERSGTANGTVVSETGATSLEQFASTGGDGRWTERQVPWVVAACLAKGATWGPLDAVLLGAWQHLLSRTADSPVTVWTALDARRDAIPPDTLGQLTTLRAWRPGRSASVSEAIREAVAWVDAAVMDSLGWQERPAELPPYAFCTVPGRVIRGSAVLEPPRVEPWAERLMMVVSVTHETSIDLRLWHAPTIDDADADELIDAYVRLVCHLAEERPPVSEWNGTREPLVHPLEASQPSVWSRVLRQAASYPDAVALVGDVSTLTYAELVDRVSVLAQMLRDRGVGAESRVVVHMAESIDQAVALLGVAAAGAAYVPVGAHLPIRRIAELVELSGAVIALTDGGVGTARIGLPAIERPAFAAAAKGGLAALDFGADVDGSALAYVMHTSGSTGTPKGVMVTRRGLAAYVAAALNLYELGPGDTVLTQTSPMFDLSVTSLLVPLAAGARVVVVDPQSGIDGLAQAIRRERDIALLKLTPSHLTLLATLGLSAADASIRRVVVGGEQLRTDVAREWQTRFPECAVVNEYGPTETVVGVTVCEMGARDVGTSAVPIGRAVTGAWVAVCDPDGRPFENGIPGEVVIGGATVARGYIGDPRQTAEHFVPDLAGPPGSRAYRTGDVAVATASRGLLFRGRSDRQISLRGFRVEPAEVERALLDIAGVCAAVVVSRANPVRGDELLAYVVFAPGVKVDVRGELSNRVPSYLVPGVVVEVDALPMTASGKVDVQALPAPRRCSTTAEVEGGLEAVIAEIWADVLGCEPPGLDDKFFESGGSSFTLVTLNASLRAAFNRDVSLTAMFDAPTVRDLAELVRTSPPSPGTHATDQSVASNDPTSSGVASSSPTGIAPGSRVTALHRLREGRSGA